MMDKIVPEEKESLPTLNPQYWNQLYIDQVTQWDLGDVSSPIKSFVDQWENKSSRILIPGGGYSHEASYLVKQNFQSISVLDISNVLVAKLRNQFIHHPEVHIFEQNFFVHQGTYDLILEQTFFCALDPSLRNSYVEKMIELLSPGGHLAGVLFNREFEAPGPPFGGNLQEYQKLFEPRFEILKLEACHNSHPKRQGNELSFHLIKK